MGKLTDAERNFLMMVRGGERLPVATREQDRTRQSLRKRGLVEVLQQPRRWSLTDAGRAALQEPR